MFRSVASYLFGSNSTTDTKSKEIATATDKQSSTGNDFNLCTDPENIIEVTSLTPSVTGSTVGGDRNLSAAAAASNRAVKRGKNSRNNARQQNKRKGLKNQQAAASKTGDHSTVISSCDEDFDEDEWYIVEKEDEFDLFSPDNNTSEGNKNSHSVSEIVQSVKAPTIAASPLAQQRRLQHINSHSLYSGPRPQKQRNYLQKSRNNNVNTNNNNNSNRKNGLSVSTLSPSRTVNDARCLAPSGPTAGLTADGGMTRSLYADPAVVTVVVATSDNASTNGKGVELNRIKTTKMDESWFVTPPPCFTSIGPINMETSPYENLLIEHPSMSVYHSIKTAQEAAESFVKLDLGVKERKEERPAKENVPRKNSQAVQQRSSGGFRLDRQSVAQLKQELMARSVQKTQTKMERKDIRRSAINRANKTREVQSKNHTSRRADRQHCRIVSGANNNRKCCF